MPYRDLDDAYEQLLAALRRPGQSPRLADIIEQRVGEELADEEPRSRNVRRSGQRLRIAVSVMRSYLLDARLCLNRAISLLPDHEVYFEIRDASERTGAREERAERFDPRELESLRSVLDDLEQLVDQIQQREHGEPS